MNIFDEVNSGETMLDRALALWEMGFHIFPLGSPYEDDLPDYIVKRFGSVEEAKAQWPKTPRISWSEYQTRPPTEEEVRDWWTKWPMANIAIVTGIQFDVVDADSNDAVAWCTSGAITRTPWENHTGRGVQFLYRKTDLDVRNSANADTKIDTRGVGGYIVAPGSTHSNGKVYQLVCDNHFDIDSPDDLPALTSSDLVALGNYRSPAPEGAYTFSIDTSNVCFGVDEDGAPQGERNNKCAQLAGKFINEGDDMQTAKHKLLKWNDKNTPPLSESEIDQTLRSVVKTHQRNNPDRPVQAAPPPIAQDGPETSEHTIFSIADLMDDPPEKPESLWGGPAFFKGCRMMIVGAPKTGKSRWLAAFLASLAANGEFLGEPVTRPQRTFWLNAEIHKAWLHERLWPIIKNASEAELVSLRKNFRLTGRIRLDITNPVHFDIIMGTIQELGIDTVAFDPFINFSSANENDNTEIRAVLDMFDALQAKTGVSVILVHHSRKANKMAKDNDAFETIRGASALRGWYDTGVVLQPIEGTAGQGLTVSWELRNGENRPPHCAQWNEFTGSYELMDMQLQDTAITSGNVPEGSRRKYNENDVHKAKMIAAEMEIGRHYERKELLPLLQKISVTSETKIGDVLAALKYETGACWMQTHGNKGYYIMPGNPLPEDEE